MNYQIDKTDISNINIKAIEDINQGSYIGIWLTDYSNGGRVLWQNGMLKKWYETEDLGRYCNHSNNPNTVVFINEFEKSIFNRITKKFEIVNSTEIKLISKGILTGEEITVDYRLAEYLTKYKININF